MPLPLVSTSGVTPSALYKANELPAGNEDVATATSKLSVPLPVLVNTLLNVTVLPWAALATVEPEAVTLAVWFTVNTNVLVLAVGIGLTPSL